MASLRVLTVVSCLVLLGVSPGAQGPPPPPPLPIGQGSSFLTLPVPPIVFDKVQRVTDGRGWGTSFGNVAISCPLEGAQPLVRQLYVSGEPVTLADVLGPGVRSLSVRRYHTWRFKTDDEVRDYIRTTLTARPPEGVWPRQAWSEVTPVNVVIVTEWADGRFGRFDLGGQPEGGRYAHLQDRRGCEWWARFPPDR
jgi:hypothetical protein